MNADTLMQEEINGQLKELYFEVSYLYKAYRDGRMDIQTYLDNVIGHHAEIKALHELEQWLSTQG